MYSSGLAGTVQMEIIQEEFQDRPDERVQYLQSLVNHLLQHHSTHHSTCDLALRQDSRQVLSEQCFSVTSKIYTATTVPEPPREKRRLDIIEYDPNLPNRRDRGVANWLKMAKSVGQNSSKVKDWWKTLEGIDA